MDKRILKDKNPIWSKFERLFGVMGFFAAITAIFGVYYQLQTKQNKIEFQILSKDYLTLNSNIDGLTSNYEYEGTPIKNLWLLRIRIENSGDGTIIGSGDQTDLLTNSIVFEFDTSIQILNNIELIQSNLPDHRLSHLDSNSISLSFDQWRKNEFVVYSIYLKSDKHNISFIPTAKRVIKDGHISIIDLTQSQQDISKPLLDKFFSHPIPLIARILGLLLTSVAFIIISYYMIFLRNLFLG